MTELEICCYTLKACCIAQREGANRIELCSAIREGGITPSTALIQLAREALTIDLFVMIRPRGGDFCYTDEEYKQMLLEIDLAKAAGANGVVVGILSPDGSVDKVRTHELVKRAAPLEVTFHRAFDMTANLSQALEDVIDVGCTRILTSGGRNSAPQGIDQLRELSVQSKNRIKIMAGAGVNAENAEALVNVGVHALHFSAGSVYAGLMEYKNPLVSMSTANTLSEYDLSECSPSKVREMIKTLTSLHLRS